MNLGYKRAQRWDSPEIREGSPEGATPEQALQLPKELIQHRESHGNNPEAELQVISSGPAEEGHGTFGKWESSSVMSTL